jgi:hypothetical protein
MTSNQDHHLARRGVTVNTNHVQLSPDADQESSSTRKKYLKRRGGKKLKRSVREEFSKREESRRLKRTAQAMLRMVDAVWGFIGTRRGLTE